MPIERTAFTREFTLLLERFGREPHKLMTARYFEYLNARLTTEEFTAAAGKLFEEARYWPAPVEFIHAAKGDPKQLANDAWNALEKAMKTGRPQDVPGEALQTLRRIGATYRDLQEASEYRLGELQRAFKAEHGAPLPEWGQLGTTRLSIEGPK